VASGDTPPGVVERSGEIGFGLRDPSQLIKFAQSAAQAVNPAGFGQYSAGKTQIQQRYHVNVDTDLIDQLNGDLATTTSVNGKSSSRVALKDPAAFKRTLKKLGPALSGLSSGAATVTRPKKGQDLYGLSLRGGRKFVFGVIGKVFVVSNDAAGAKRFASESPTEIGNAKGAGVLKADAEQVANAALARLGPRLGLGGRIRQPPVHRPAGRAERLGQLDHEWHERQAHTRHRLGGQPHGFEGFGSGAVGPRFSRLAVSEVPDVVQARVDPRGPS